MLQSHQRLKSARIDSWTINTRLHGYLLELPLITLKFVNTIWVMTFTLI